MDWNERLREFCERSELPKKAIAAEWHQRVSESGALPRPPAVSTTISNLSKCLKPQKDGVSCFFKDRARAEVLFQLLGVDSAERDALFEGAEDYLASGGQLRPKLVVDATAWPGGAEHCSRMFSEILRVLVAGGPLRPVLLLIGTSQYSWLPREYDDLPDVDVLRVADAAAAKTTALKAAEQGALLATPWSPPDAARWVATYFDGSTLVVAPDDGLETFRRTGALPVPTTPHPLSDIAEEAEWEWQGGLSLDELAPTAVAKWHLRFELVDESNPRGWPAELRYEIAKALNTPVASTEAERAVAEADRVSRSLALEPELVAEEGLSEYLDRARRRPVADVLLRDGDSLHLINPSGPAPSSAQLEVHRVECPEPAITRLRAAASDWTQDDADDDPFLEQLIERLDPEGRDRDAFLHARACLLHHHVIKPHRVRGLKECPTALKALLEGQAPDPSLRIFQSVGEKEYRQAIVPARYLEEGDKEGLPDFELPLLYPLEGLSKLQRASRRDDLVVLRRTAYDARSARRADQRPGFRRERRSPPKPASVLMPAKVEDLDDVGLWLDSLEASVHLGGTPPRSLDESLFVENRELWERKKLSVGRAVWHGARIQLAFLWPALQRAVAADAWIEVPGTSTALLPLSGGLAAEVLVRKHTTNTISAEFAALPERNDYTELGLEAFLPTHNVRSGRGYFAVGPQQIPIGLRLSGRGWRADLTFCWSPLLGDIPSLEAAAGAAAAIVAQDD